MNGARSLKTLLAGLVPVPEWSDLLITGLCSNSRQVSPGDLFLATRGLRHHGLDFLAEVRAAGAVAVIWEPPFDGDVNNLTPALPVLAVESLSHKIGLIAERFYDEPCRNLDLIGVTGTNGKTSCTHFIAQCLSTVANSCGIVGTLGNGVFGRLSASGFTTPDALSLHRWLAEMRAMGLPRVVMEVSSHALEQGRVAGLDFTVAVLTNLSRDHLDYHGDIAAYGAAKRRLFCEHRPLYAVLNLDDAFGRELAAELRGAVDVVGYGLSEPVADSPAALVWGEALSLSPGGLRLQVRSSWGNGALRVNLLGRFNAANILASLATLLVLGVPFDEALRRLSRVSSVAGRMECFGGRDGRPLAVVDYAHTPDALRQSLAALREHTHGRLVCVFGCGGDRDTGKRPQMGAIAEHYADRVIVTNDNPRSEDPQRIVGGILAGMHRPESSEVVYARDAAIERALDGAGPQDIVLIAGKGHEEYQLLDGQCLLFSDREAVCCCLGAVR